MGAGTASVRTIVTRYDGQAQFTWKDGIFSVSGVLTLPNKIDEQHGG